MGDSTGVAPVVERKKHRSPAYPAIDLRAAITRAEQFYAQERRNPASIAAIASHWKYGQKSSGLLTAVAALKHFGLMKEIGSGQGPGRSVQLTDLALRIILDPRADSTERQAAIKEAALFPKIHRELWRRYNGQLPSDQELKVRLLLDWNFNDNTVADFVRELRQTIQFAKLGESDVVSKDITDNADSINNDVDGEQRDGKGEGDPESPPRSKSEPAAKPGALLKHAVLLPQERRAGMRQDVFSLSEGEVTLQWPASLSPESFEDVRDWLDIVKRKIGRSVKTELDEPTTTGEE